MRFLKAVKIFDGERYLEPGAVVVLDDHGILQDIISETGLDPGRIRALDGMLMPGFVNAHCHLELSHLYKRIPPGTGLPAFGEQVVKLRGKMPAEAVVEAVVNADREMRRCGIAAVGDISNNRDSFSTKAASAMYYHTFIELIGLHPDQARQVFEEGSRLVKELSRFGLNGSLAPHAPYSVSPPLMRLIAAYDSEHGLPCSIHHAESGDEIAFLEGGPSGFHQLYKNLGIDISWYRPPRVRPSVIAKNAVAGDMPLLLVHNTYAAAGDVSALRSNSVYWCLCPRANVFISGRMPDFRILGEVCDRICFGTDSLAGNTDLDLLKDASAFAGAAGMTADDPVILKGLTINAARALNISHKFGKLARGRNAGLNLVKAEGATMVLREIIS